MVRFFCASPGLYKATDLLKHVSVTVEGGGEGNKKKENTDPQRKFKTGKLEMNDFLVTLC